MPDGRKVTKRRISTWVGNTVCTLASCRMQSGECGKKNVRTGRIFTRFFHHTKRSRAGAEQARRLRSQPPERARRTTGSGKNGFTFPAVCGMLIISVCSPRGNALYHSQRKRTASHRKSFAAPVCFRAADRLHIVDKDRRDRMVCLFRESGNEIRVHRTYEY